MFFGGSLPPLNKFDQEAFYEKDFGSSISTVRSLWNSGFCQGQRRLVGNPENRHDAEIQG
jgi:hypothetical protein